MDEEQELFVEGCERRVIRAAEWLGRLRSWRHDKWFWDSEGAGGTAEVVLDLPGQVPSDLVDEYDAQLELRERERILEA
eukprot:7558306-Pyramimonas_sp.AAC.1